LVILLVALGHCLAADEGLSRVKISKIGKPATALVEVKARNSYGSAFCIHPSGLFLTNEHVVQPPGMFAPNGRVPPVEITLVLNPGLKTEKSYSARVVRADKELDLALLRVESANEFPALSLGSDEKLEELMEVVAFGFPFGTALASGRREYPSVSVNAGSITSLRRKDGQLYEIQLDVTLNPGNSGGPVLDQNGKVVGVVKSGVLGRGVNFAVPVSVLSRFVSRPDIQFEPPELTPGNIHKPVSFVARVTPILPSSAPIAVDLSLKPARGRERTFPMKADGDKFRVRAVPLPPPPGTLTLRLLARFNDGALNATLADQAFKVGERSVKLSEVRSIDFGATPRVVLHDEEKIEGTVSGLDATPVHLGGQTLTLNLAKATEVKFAPAVDTRLLWYTLRVRQGDKELLRRSESLPVQGLIPAPSARAERTPIKPPELEGDQVVRKLSEPMDDVAVGGAGRYLVLRLPKARKLTVFDVSAAKIAGHIPLAEEGALFAAGLEDVLVVLPGAATIERWSLKTLERDVAATLPIQGVIKSIAMGSASHGPLLIHWAVGTQPLDRAVFTSINTETMKAVVEEIKMPPACMLGGHYRDLVHMRAAANGQVFGMWCTSHTPSGAAMIAITNTGANSHYLHSDEGHILPSPDGKTVFTRYGKRPPVVEFSQLSRTGTALLPACSGNYYLELPQANKAGNPIPGGVALPGQPAKPPTDTTHQVVIYSTEQGKPIATLNDLQLPPLMGEQWIKHDFTFDKRIHLIPEARLVITIPAANDRLVLHRYGG
jgi:hypothetical protein